MKSMLMPVALAHALAAWLTSCAGTGCGLFEGCSNRGVAGHFPGAPRFVGTRCEPPFRESQFPRETVPRATSRLSEIKRERCIPTTLTTLTIRRAAPRSHCLSALNRFPRSLSDDLLSMHPPDNWCFCHWSIAEPLPGGGQRPRAPNGAFDRWVRWRRAVL
jgi:hypothetical protein